MELIEKIKEILKKLSFNNGEDYSGMDGRGRQW
jgi:hypothetical protein